MNKCISILGKIGKQGGVAMSSKYECRAIKDAYDVYTRVLLRIHELGKQIFEADEKNEDFKSIKQEYDYLCAIIDKKQFPKKGL